MKELFFINIVELCSIIDPVLRIYGSIHAGLYGFKLYQLHAVSRSRILKWTREEKCTKTD
jgi:hypothetical protein